MATTGERARIVLAVPAASPIDRLWAAAEEAVAGMEAEIVVMLLSDDRWQRAASLPFTREISRISARHSAFTQQRAEQIAGEATARTRAIFQELAGKANRSCSFCAVSESQPDHIHEVVASSSVFVAPSSIKGLSLFASVERIGCRIVLVDT